MAYIRHPGPDSSFRFQVKVLQPFDRVPSSLGIGQRNDEPRDRRVSRSYGKRSDFHSLAMKFATRMHY